jgi:hypothetical protein
MPIKPKSKHDMEHILDLLNLHHTDIKSDLNVVHRDMATIKEDVSNINVTNAEHKAILDEHMRRTEVNEQTLELLRSRREEDVAILYKELQPVKSQMAFFGILAKTLTAVAAAGSIVAVLYKLL